MLLTLPALLVFAPFVRWQNGVCSCEARVMQEPSCEGFLLSRTVDVALPLMLHYRWCCTTVDVALPLMLHYRWCCTTNNDYLTFRYPVHTLDFAGAISVCSLRPVTKWRVLLWGSRHARTPMWGVPACCTASNGNDYLTFHHPITTNDGCACVLRILFVIFQLIKRPFSRRESLFFLHCPPNFETRWKKE